MLSNFVPMRPRDANYFQYTTSTGVSFYQCEDTIPGPPAVRTNNVIETRVSCWRCDRKGHRSTFCPVTNNVANGGFQGMQLSFSQNLTEINNFVQASWILIDTGSTFNFV